MSELLQKWFECQLEDILIAVESGSRPKGGVRNINDGVPSIGGEHLNYKGGFDFTNLRFVPNLFANKMNRGHIRKKDILIVKDGATTGKTSFVNENFPYENAVVNEHVFICRTSPLVESKFVFRFLTSKDGQNNILENFQGSAQGGINTKFVSNTTIPLAPLNEQKRIVEKLDKLLTQVDESKRRLEKIPVIIKRFRQSVLNSAVTGELTEDWREENNINESTWEEKTLIEITPKGSIFDGPFGSNLKTIDYTTNGVRVIRLENIGHLRFIRDKYSFISYAKYQTLKKHTVYKNDILFSSFIADEIRVCILPELQETAIAKADCFCIRPNDKINRRYLLLQLASHNSFEKLTENIHGATRPRINLSQLKQLTLLICSLEEQKEIVKRVDALFKKADEIEERYKKAKAFVDKLTQSILAKAFRGELVPQDPKDEPASGLLEKIKLEKENLNNDKKQKKDRRAGEPAERLLERAIVGKNAKTTAKKNKAK